MRINKDGQWNYLRQMYDICRKLETSLKYERDNRPVRREICDNGASDVCGVAHIECVILQRTSPSYGFRLPGFPEFEFRNAD